MTNEIFSRAYLRDLPEQYKQQHLNAIIQSFIGELKSEAQLGKTSYTYIPKSTNQYNVGSPPTPAFTNADLVAAFKLRFPDCNVSYQENWVTVSPWSNKIFQAGIIIDWS
jgi:hypothetical protein